MIHWFKTSKGTVFGYDNEFNSLIDKNHKLLSLPHDLDQGYIDFINTRNADSNKEILKSNQPRMIKLSLGQKCNYSCGYCSQKELGDNSPSLWGNLKREMEIAAVGNLIKDMKKNLDFSHLKRFEIWGGETLIFFKEIEMIMNEFDNPDIVWYIPTNGTLLENKHIDFWNTLKGTVTLGISHDGHAHEITRGLDFLERKVEVIRKLQQSSPKIQFSFNPVISRENFNLFELDQFFKNYITKHNLKPIPLSMELITVYNLEEVRGDSKSWAITENNLPAYKNILRDYLKEHAIQYKNKTDKLLLSSLAEIGFGFLPYAKTLQKQDIRHAGCNCQADQEGQLSIDTSGNVKTCQNVGKEFAFGNINSMTEVAVTNVNTNKKSRCESCNVRFLCNSGCPLPQPNEVFDINCALYKVHYGEIQKAAFEYIFNDSVKKID